VEDNGLKRTGEEKEGEQERRAYEAAEGDGFREKKTRRSTERGEKRERGGVEKEKLKFDAKAKDCLYRSRRGPHVGQRGGEQEKKRRQEPAGKNYPRKNYEAFKRSEVHHVAPQYSVSVARRRTKREREAVTQQMENCQDRLDQKTEV